MGQQVALARAANLLGVSRQDLQRLVHDGDLETFEGKVDMDDLRQRYPTIALNDSPEYERTSLIRQTAFARRVSDTVAPDTDSLERQLRKRNADLSIANAKMQKFRGCINELAQLLGDLNREANPEQKQVINVVNSWLLDKLET